MKAYVATHDCGYRKASKTQALADRGLNLHSCERQRLIIARSERAAARRTSEGVKRDCQCKQARHEHGTRQAYVIDGCHRRPCRDANAEVMRTQSRLKAYGRYDVGRVDAEPVRQHIANLMTYGIGMKRIAALAGVSNATLGKIMYGDRTRNMPPRARTERRVAEAVLEVQQILENLAGGQIVDGTGTARRLQALVTIGWPQSQLAQMAGFERSNFGPVVLGRNVTAATARKVQAIYNQHWNDPQTGHDWHTRTAATRARNYAKARDWAPPLAWDDETIDDPTATPAGLETVSTYGTKHEQRMEDLEHLLDSNVGYAELMARLGVNKSTLDGSLHRAGRQDLGTRLRELSDARDYRRTA